MTRRQAKKAYIVLFSLIFGAGVWGEVVSPNLVGFFMAIAVVLIIYLLRRHLWKWTRRLTSLVWRRLRKKPDLVAADLDRISWSDFEQLVGHAFEARGYVVRYTPRTADHGLDVVAEKGKQRVGVQCKRYEGTVGSDAIKAVVAGSQFYQCNRSLVVCTSSFTRNAIEEADRLGVELWDRKRLESELRWL